MGNLGVHALLYLTYRVLILFTKCLCEEIGEFNKKTAYFALSWPKSNNLSTYIKLMVVNKATDVN